MAMRVPPHISVPSDLPLCGGLPRRSLEGICVRGALRRNPSTATECSSGRRSRSGPPGTHDTRAGEPMTETLDGAVDQASHATAVFDPDGPAYRGLLADGAGERDAARGALRPFVRRLRALGLGAARVPRDAGGAGLSITTLFTVVSELARAEPSRTSCTACATTSCSWRGSCGAGPLRDGDGGSPVSWTASCTAARSTSRGPHPRGAPGSRPACWHAGRLRARRSEDLQHREPVLPVGLGDRLGRRGARRLGRDRATPDRLGHHALPRGGGRSRRGVACPRGQPPFPGPQALRGHLPAAVAHHHDRGHPPGGRTGCRRARQGTPPELLPRCRRRAPPGARAPGGRRPHRHGRLRRRRGRPGRGTPSGGGLGTRRRRPAGRRAPPRRLARRRPRQDRGRRPRPAGRDRPCSTRGVPVPPRPEPISTGTGATSAPSPRTIPRPTRRGASATTRSTGPRRWTRRSSDDTPVQHCGDRTISNCACVNGACTPNRLASSASSHATKSTSSSFLTANTASESM